MLSPFLAVTYTAAVNLCSYWCCGIYGSDLPLPPSPACAKPVNVVRVGTHEAESGPLHPSSVQFSHSVMSDSLQPHGLQHARLPCPSSTPGAYSNSCPLSQWCHAAILFSCCPLLFLPSIFPSISVFSNESVLCIRWRKYWSFSFSLRPSNDYSGLISFRMDWLDLFAIQGTLKSLLQHHSLKASILRCSIFFIVQLSHPYMTTGKTIALSRWTFVSKVMSLHPNTKLNLRQSFGWSIAFPGKEGHSKFMPSNLCPQYGRIWWDVL